MVPEVMFKALADPTRQKALTVLSTHELGVSELVEVLRQPQSTVSRHLRILREARLIQDERNGNAVVYSVCVPVATPLTNATGLTGRILEWVAQQPLDTGLRNRLNAVLERRRAMSDRFFDQVGHHWDALREEAFGRTFPLEAMLALLPHDWVVADIGTGTGYLLPALSRRFKRIIAVDPVDTMLEAARTRIQQVGLGANVNLKRGDLSRLPIRTSSVDLAVAMLVLHHVPSPQRAVAELCRIVRPDGSFLIVEQNTHENEQFRERMQDRWWGFEPDGLAKQLESAGFERVSHNSLATVEPPGNAPGLFVVTGRKAAQSRNGSRKRASR